MKFTESPYFLLKDFLNIIAAGIVEYDTIIDPNIESSYVSGGLTSIVTGTDGDDGSITLYKKIDEGFYPFKAIPLGEPTEGKYFKFEYKNIDTVTPGDSITETLTGAGYQLDLWNSTSEDTENISSNVEIYFRKDSSFHDWLKSDELVSAEQYYLHEDGLVYNFRNFVNTDKMFLYFGKMYATDETDIFHIPFEGIKDFATKIIPEHQRSEKLIEFMELFFDKVYNEGYNLQKDILTLKDPDEINLKYLGYLSRYYGIDIDDYPIDEYAFGEVELREFTKGLIHLLQRKGTYSSITILWKILSANSPNLLNIYEKWHDGALSGTIPVSGYENHRYTAYYGMETPDASIDYSDYDLADYPEDYSPTGKILSTGYEVEVDLSHQPVTDTAILPENVIKSLYKYWEIIRPINRVSHYNQILTPIVDFSGAGRPTYSGDYINQMITWAPTLSHDSDVEDAFLYLPETGSDEWTFEHGLGENVIVQFYSSDFILMEPETINIDETIVATFATSFYGFALVKASISTHNNNNGLSPWIINHGLDSGIITQAIDVNRDAVIPDINIVDSNIVSVTMADDVLTDGYLFITDADYTHTQSAANIMWEIDHNLGHNGVISVFYDMSGNRIYPEKMQLISGGSAIAVFDEAVSGYASIISVGTAALDGFFLPKDPITGEYILPSFSCGVNEYDGSADVEAESVVYSGVAEKVYRVEDGDVDYYIIKCGIPIDLEFELREFKVENDYGDILIYGYCSPFYKINESKFDLYFKMYTNQ